MRKKNLSSKVKILFLMFLYYQILAFYVLSFIILINTNGMISTNIKNNILILQFYKFLSHTDNKDIYKIFHF